VRKLLLVVSIGLLVSCGPSEMELRRAKSEQQRIARDLSDKYAQTLMSSDVASACEIKTWEMATELLSGGLNYRFKRISTSVSMFSGEVVPEYDVPEIEIALEGDRVLGASVGAWYTPFDYKVAPGTNRDLNCVRKLFAYILKNADSNSISDAISTLRHCPSTRIKDYVIRCKEGDVDGAGYISLKLN
jgi:hypothetical protein